MPPSSYTGNAATPTRDRAGAGTSAPAPAAAGPGPGKAGAEMLGRGKAGAEILGRLRRRAGGYRDPLFERPDLVEDDYHRFLSQSSG